MDGCRPLPKDVVVNILLRLHVESLLRFKCVQTFVSSHQKF